MLVVVVILDCTVQFFKVLVCVSWMAALLSPSRVIKHQSLVADLGVLNSFEIHSAVLPLLSPVLFFSSESVKNRDNLFYLQPLVSCHPDSPRWFSSQPLDGATLDSMLTRILAVRQVHLDEGSEASTDDGGSPWRWRVTVTMAGHLDDRLKAFSSVVLTDFLTERELLAFH